MEKTKKRLQWHPAFFAGLQIEFKDEEENLIFENEHQLGTKPNQIDVLIIKKISHKPIQKNIGRIFRKHNIIEYKPPGDYLSIDDFYKVYAYTCFYKADTPHVNDIKIDDVTMTLVAHKCPLKLITHLKSTNHAITYASKGIYYVDGLMFPIQIILTSELPPEENLWLRSLTNDLEKENTARQILQEYEKHQKDTRYESVMNLLTTANKHVFEEDKIMCEALMEIAREKMKDELEHARESGLEHGLERGSKLIQELVKSSRTDEIERAVTDKDYREKLLKEFGV